MGSGIFAVFVEIRMKACVVDQALFDSTDHSVVCWQTNRFSNEHQLSAPCTTETTGKPVKLI